MTMAYLAASTEAPCEGCGSRQCVMVGASKVRLHAGPECPTFREHDAYLSARERKVAESAPADARPVEWWSPEQVLPLPDLLRVAARRLASFGYSFDAPMCADLRAAQEHFGKQSPAVSGPLLEALAEMAKAPMQDNEVEWARRIAQQMPMNPIELQATPDRWTALLANEAAEFRQTLARAVLRRAAK